MKSKQYFLLQYLVVILLAPFQAHAVRLSQGRVPSKPAQIFETTFLSIAEHDISVFKHQTNAFYDQARQKVRDAFLQELSNQYAIISADWIFHLHEAKIQKINDAIAKSLQDFFAQINNVHCKSDGIYSKDDDVIFLQKAVLSCLESLVDQFFECNDSSHHEIITIVHEKSQSQPSWKFNFYNAFFHSFLITKAILFHTLQKNESGLDYTQDISNNTITFMLDEQRSLKIDRSFFVTVLVPIILTLVPKENNDTISSFIPSTDTALSDKTASQESPTTLLLKRVTPARLTRSDSYQKQYEAMRGLTPSVSQEEAKNEKIISSHTSSDGFIPKGIPSKQGQKSNVDTVTIKKQRSAIIPSSSQPIARRLNKKSTIVWPPVSIEEICKYLNNTRDPFFPLTMMDALKPKPSDVVMHGKSSAIIPYSKIAQPPISPESSNINTGDEVHKKLPEVHKKNSIIQRLSTASVGLEVFRSTDSLDLEGLVESLAHDSSSTNYIKQLTHFIGGGDSSYNSLKENLGYTKEDRYDFYIYQARRAHRLFKTSATQSPIYENLSKIFVCLALIVSMRTNEPLVESIQKTIQGTAFTFNDVIYNNKNFAVGLALEKKVIFPILQGVCEKMKEVKNIYQLQYQLNDLWLDDNYFSFESVHDSKVQAVEQQALVELKLDFTLDSTKDELDLTKINSSDISPEIPQQSLRVSNPFLTGLDQWNKNPGLIGAPKHAKYRGGSSAIVRKSL